MRYIRPAEEFEIETRMELIEHADARPPQEGFDVLELKHDNKVWILGYLVPDINTPSPIRDGCGVEVFHNDNRNNALEFQDAIGNVDTEEIDTFYEQEPHAFNELYILDHDRENPTGIAEPLLRSNVGRDRISHEGLVAYLMQYREYRESVARYVNRILAIFEEDPLALTDDQLLQLVAWRRFLVMLDEYLVELDATINRLAPSPYRKEMRIHDVNSSFTAVIVPDEAFIKALRGQYNGDEDAVHDHLQRLAKNYKSWAEGESYALTLIIMEDGMPPQLEELWGMIGAEYALTRLKKAFSEAVSLMRRFYHIPEEQLEDSNA